MILYMYINVIYQIYVHVRRLSCPSAYQSVFAVFSQLFHSLLLSLRKLQKLVALVAPVVQCGVWRQIGSHTHKYMHYNNKYVCVAHWYIFAKHLIACSGYFQKSQIIHSDYANLWCDSVSSSRRLCTSPIVQVCQEEQLRQVICSMSTHLLFHSPFRTHPCSLQGEDESIKLILTSFEKRNGI